MHDRAAFQYHNTIGQPQNLLRILLDDDRADAAGPGDGAERPEQFLDDDRRQALGRLVQQQHLGIEGQRAADRQHLLLAAGKLVAEIAAALLQPRKHLVDLFDGPGAGLGHRRHVFFHRQRTEDIALLRHPADPRPRPLVRAHRRNVQSAERQGAAEAAGDADDRIDQRGLAGAVAPEQRQHLAFGQRQRHRRQHDRFAVAGAQAVDGKKIRHRWPRRDRPP